MVRDQEADLFVRFKITGLLTEPRPSGQQIFVNVTTCNKYLNIDIAVVSSEHLGGHQSRNNVSKEFPELISLYRQVSIGTTFNYPTIVCS